MTANRIPGGIIEGGEWLTVDDKPMFITAGVTHEFWNSPEWAIEALRKDMKSKPHVEKAMVVLVGTSEEAKLEQFTKCQFGALNTSPDIDVNGNLSAPEYVPCDCRKTCTVQGIGCNNIMVQEGVFLTKVETEVIKLVIWPDRIIAIMLGMSELTVKTHFKNIRVKMGLQSKLQIVHWLTQRGII